MTNSPVSQQEAAAELLRRRQARNSILAFTTYTMPTFEVSWHHEVMSEYIDKFANKEIKRLMIFMPPRHTKSEFVSRRLPAYLLGRNPDESIIAASYGADLASRMNRDVQRIIDSEDYRRIFPDTRLFGKNIRTVASGSWLRNSDMFEVVEYSGYYRGSGIGGAITGMGMTCLPKCAIISTIEGDFSISTLFEQGKPVLVKSFSHAKQCVEYKEIRAFSRKLASEFVKITTVSGKVLTCTVEHPVYVKGKGYIEAQAVQIGDIVQEVHPLWNTLVRIAKRFLPERNRQRNERKGDFVHMLAIWIQRSKASLLSNVRIAEKSSIKLQKTLSELKKTFVQRNVSESGNWEPTTPHGRIE